MSASLSELIESTLHDRGLDFSRKEGGHFVVTLPPGENKLETTALLTVGNHGVRFEAFVCRKPDENFEGVYKYLLRRNRRLYGVAYTLDKIGDIYLVGRLSEQSVTPEELDAVLGQILEAADYDFNVLLGLGFLTSIKREWAWRVSRGESLRNLEPFRHLIENDGAGTESPDISGSDAPDEDAQQVRNTSDTRDPVHRNRVTLVTLWVWKRKRRWPR